MACGRVLRNDTFDEQQQHAGGSQNTRTARELGRHSSDGNGGGKISTIAGGWQFREKRELRQRPSKVHGHHKQPPDCVRGIEAGREQ